MAPVKLQKSAPTKVAGSPKQAAAHGWRYHVFLSFRGADTRHLFTDILRRDLGWAGIQVYRDYEDIPIGSGITSELRKAIKESTIYIVIFSKNYAASRWCLDEVMKIVESNQTTGRLIIPVFYDVHPEEVSRRDGIYRQAIEGLKRKSGDPRVSRWRKAITQVAKSEGYSLINKPVTGFLEKIVEKVVTRIHPKKLRVAMYPVALDDSVAAVIHKLRLDHLDDVRFVQIQGMVGLGKSVIAKAVYNQILEKFDCCSFLADVSKVVSDQYDGLLHLQKQLLSDVPRIEDFRTVDRGTELIATNFRSKKILLVIDDVHELSPIMNSLAAKPEWFGRGSRIIITTRVKNLLKKYNPETYKPEELSSRHSLELLCWFAFGEPDPLEGYDSLLEEVIGYTGGNPYAIEVLGSHFCEQPMERWQTAFEALKLIPLDKILRRFQSSYDALLNNDTSKYIFLAIACFFNGMDRSYVTDVVKGHCPNAGYHIDILVDRYLLEVTANNELRMNTLLCQTGREIVRRKFDAAAKRIRMWSNDDIHHVHLSEKVAAKTEGAVLCAEEEMHLSTGILARMQRLKMLQITNVNLQGDFGNLPKTLRLLGWQNCPFESLPLLQLDLLVALDLRHGKMLMIGESLKSLKNLKILDLSHSTSLQNTPEFRGLEKLEKLLLEGCTGLHKVYESIGNLCMLHYLSLKDCTNLSYLPDSICKLGSLQHLNLNGCSALEWLPNNLGDIDCLRELLADGTSLQGLPESFRSLKNLTRFSLQGRRRRPKHWLSQVLLTPWLFLVRPSTNFLASVQGLCSLTSLVLRDCSLSDEDIPMDLGSLSALKCLDLGGNNFSKLPSSLDQLSNLESLWLDNCKKPVSVPKPPPNLKNLYLKDSTTPEIKGSNGWFEVVTEETAHPPTPTFHPKE